MMSHPGSQTITIHILPNISRNKGNETRKFGQLLEYNTKNVFLEKSYINCDEEIIPKPFSQKSNWSLCLDQ